jgi:curved DNA-binding protein CbpA
MPEGLRDAYRFLDLPPRSSLADARRRYREMAKKLHPDVSGRTADMARLNDAWERIVAFFIA